MARYELLGKTLAHSHSKKIHDALGLYKYNLRELPDELAVKQYLAAGKFSGCNVTIPYKQTVMPLCDALDNKAKEIGSVNTIVNNCGFLTGYNTDYDGFEYMLKRKEISLRGKKVLLLGNGGTAKTVIAVAKNANAADVKIASRSGGQNCISYAEALRQKHTDIIINTSPVGMYPASGSTPIDISGFANLSAVVDVIYNPLTTRLLYNAQQMGIPTANGLPMLVAQAVAAARLFTGHYLDSKDTERVLGELHEELTCLVLIGMPSSGKTKLGKAVARSLRKSFVDIDTVIEEAAGKTIKDIFEQEGEEAFRHIETETLKQQTAVPGRVVSTGGGTVTRDGNNYFLHQNGVVFFIDRPLENLIAGGNRPLSADADAIAKLQKQRMPLYTKAADVIIPNNEGFTNAMYLITEAYYEIFSS